MILSILVGILVYTYKTRHHNGQPQHVSWRGSKVSGTTRRAQFSISSATDAPALIITPFLTSSNNVTDPARFGAQSGSHGWEEGMPRPPQPSTRYPEWKRPSQPLLPTFRAEAHEQAPNLLPHRNPSQTAETRYTRASSLSGYAHNNALSPQTYRTQGPSDTLSPPPFSATSTTPLTWHGPAAPTLGGGYHSPRRPEPAMVASPTTAGSSHRHPLSAGLGKTSERPFSEVSITYLVEPLSPDPRSPALVAASPIDAAYPIQSSALSRLKVDERIMESPEYGSRPPQSPSLQPPGSVVEPSFSPSFGTRRPSQPTLTPPPSAGVSQSGSRPTTPNSRIRVAEARERQERARREREDAKTQEQMRSIATGMPATIGIAKGLEARDARSKATDNKQDILDVLGEQRIDTVTHKGSWGKKMSFKRPKGMSIDTRMARGSLKGKKSPTDMGASTPRTSASSRPPPTAGIPMDIEPGPPERGLSGMSDHENGVLTNASISRSRKVDRKGTDEDRLPSWPLQALQLQSPGFGSGTSSPLTSPELKSYVTTARTPPTSAQSSALKGAPRVDVPSSSPIDNFNSPITPNTASAGLATPSWLQSTFMSAPQTSPSADVHSPTFGVPTSEPLPSRTLNVRRLPAPPEQSESSVAPRSASFVPIMVAQDPRFSIIDPRQRVATDHRRGGIDVSRTNIPLSDLPSAHREPPTAAQTSARTVQAGESGWF